MRPAAYTVPPDHTTAAGTERLLFLDGLRACAALWVVLGHAHLFALGWSRSGTLWGRPLDLLLYMHLGVNLFLVLSGFCLALPVVRNGDRLHTSNAAFFQARAWRILLPYGACLGLILLINCFVPLGAWGRNPIGLTPEIKWQVIVSNALLLQDVFPQFNSISGLFWSISIEWHLYFLFPAAVWLLRRRGPLALMGAGVALALACTFISFTHPKLSDALPIYIPQPPYFVALFVMGIVAAAFAFSPRYAACRAVVTRRAFWIGALTLIPLCALLWKYRIVGGSNVQLFIDQLHIIDPLAGAVSAALLVVLSACAPSHRARRLLEGRYLVAIGGFSYSLYLTHVPLMGAMHHAFEVLGWVPDSDAARLREFFLLASVGLALCLALAWAFARVFERRYRLRTAARNTAS